MKEKLIMDKKRLGQVMSPEYIVDKILDEADYDGDLEKNIMEPSFGDGQFLCKIIERLIAKAKEKNIDNEMIGKYIERNVFGIEKDKVLYDKALKRIECLLDTHQIKADLSKNLICGDALSEYVNFQGKFDYVVGNPPYVRLHAIDKEYRNIVRQFEFSDGTTDLYIIFYEIGLKMLKNFGRLIYISPNTFMRNTSHKKFRNYLIDNKLLKTLLDFKSEKVFDDIDAYTCICLLEKRNNKDVTYKVLRKDLSVLVKNIIPYQDFIKLRNQKWNLASKSDMLFLEKNKEFSLKIKDIATVQTGISTNRDAVYILKAFVDKEKKIPYDNQELDTVYFEKEQKMIEIERDILKPCIKVSRYEGIRDNTYIIYPYYKDGTPYTEEKLQTDFPKTYAYLLSNKEELQKRSMEQNADWFCFARSQGLKNMYHKKIIFKNILNRAECKITPYIVEKETVVFSGFFTFSQDDEKIMEIYSSKDFARYCVLVGKDMAGGFAGVSSKMISEYGIY